MSLGKNTVSGKQLLGYIERVEEIRKDKKELSDSESAVLAEAHAAGFNKKGVKFCIKVREMKPSDRQDWETLTDMYLHAIGMESEPPLFRAAGLAGIDVNIREQVVAAMHPFVPPCGQGDITVNFAGTKIRLERKKDNSIEASEVDDAPDAGPSQGGVSGKKTPKPKELAPDIANLDADGAEDLGRQFARADKPVIGNPFPFGDPRRARFDEGWRKETGNDGMGPGED